jgi:hypothetical protein
VRHPRGGVRVCPRHKHTRAAAIDYADAFNADAFNNKTDGHPDPCSDAIGLAGSLNRYTYAFTTNFAADRPYAIFCDATAIALACSFCDATGDPGCAACAVTINGLACTYDSDP